MVVGASPKAEDLVVNVCKRKHLTNTRASGSDDALRLVPPRNLSLEDCLEFLADDELLEVTPKTLRIRKQILSNQTPCKNARQKIKATPHKLCAGLPKTRVPRKPTAPIQFQSVHQERNEYDTHPFWKKALWAAS